MGLVHIYCGDGKGKTTAAVGLAVRACGAGKKILFVQFLKSESSSERRILKQLDGIELTPCPEKVKFTFRMDEAEKQECRERCAFLLRLTEERLPLFDLAVLDEVFGALSAGMLEAEELLRLVREKPEKTELVLTGRNPPPEVTAIADYITEMKKIRHPYDAGTPARKGIEF